MDPPLSSRWSKEEIAAGIKSHTQSRFSITTQHFPISKADAISALESHLAIPVPEMIFGDNLLEIAHRPSPSPSPFPSSAPSIPRPPRWALRFTARDALDAVDKTDRNMLRVAHARDWESSREETTQKIKEVVKPYDWTYSTSFRGHQAAAAAASASELVNEHGPERQGAAAERPHEERENDQATSEELHVEGEESKNQDHDQAHNGASTSNPIARQASGLQFAPTQKRIPMEVLRRRDPILFFDEVVLYESELDDNGISVYTVKIRVHETCLFILARLFMRLDGVLVRVRDTRVFVDLATDEVIREYTAKEATYKEVAGALMRSGMHVTGDFVSAMRDPNVLEPHLKTVEQHIDAVSLST